MKNDLFRLGVNLNTDGIVILNPIAGWGLYFFRFFATLSWMSQSMCQRKFPFKKSPTRALSLLRYHAPSNLDSCCLSKALSSTILSRTMMSAVLNDSIAKAEDLPPHPGWHDWGVQGVDPHDGLQVGFAEQDHTSPILKERTHLRNLLNWMNMMWHWYMNETCLVFFHCGWCWKKTN